MITSVKTALITIAIVATIAVLFFGFFFVEMMGMGGWEPNKDSPYAVRMHNADSQLRLGMTQKQVKAIFHADIAAHPSDVMEDSSNAFEGHGNPVWSDETDLTAFEPRPHWWTSYDTAWTVRAGFDNKDRLIHHRLQMDKAGGP